MKGNSLTKRKGSAEITHVNTKTEDKAATKGVTKDTILAISLAERRDITTCGNIARTTELVLISKEIEVMSTSEHQEIQVQKEKWAFGTITNVIS